MYTHHLSRCTHAYTLRKRQQRARTRRYIILRYLSLPAPVNIFREGGRPGRRAGVSDRVVQQVSPDGRPSRIRRLPRTLTDARAASQHRRTPFTTLTGQSVCSICDDARRLSSRHCLPPPTRHFCRACALVDCGAISLGARFKCRISRSQLYIQYMFVL